MISLMRKALLRAGDVAHAVSSMPDAVAQIVDMWTIVKSLRDRIERVERAIAAAGKMDERVESGEHVCIVPIGDVESLNDAIEVLLGTKLDPEIQRIVDRSRTLIDNAVEAHCDAREPENDELKRERAAEIFAAAAERAKKDENN